MEWLNLHSSTLDSAQFIGAEPTDRGTWLCLLRYCIGQENFGIITGCGEWKDRKWQQLVRVSIEEVKRPCELWRWIDENTIEVNGYPVKKQEEVQRLRGAGSAAALKRWGKTTPQAIPLGIPQGIPLGNTEGEGKGKDKGREGHTPLPPSGGGCEESIPIDPTRVNWAGDRRTTVVSFETFLDAYPLGHRRGAPAAKRTWQRVNALNDLTQTIYDAMMAWKTSRDWEKDDGAMIPTVANFLDREQWVDAPQHPGAAPGRSEAEINANIERMAAEAEARVRELEEA